MADDERLPEGMRRVGYDADTQVYTYQDEDGSYWEGSPGSRYGELHRVGQEGPDEMLLQSRRNGRYDEENRREVSPRWISKENPWRLMAPFLVLVCVFLLVVFRLLNSDGWPSSDSPKVQCGEMEEPYTIRTGDTCWKIARSHDMSVDALQQMNKKMDCDVLKIGKIICVAETDE